MPPRATMTRAYATSCCGSTAAGRAAPCSSQRTAPASPRTPSGRGRGVEKSGWIKLNLRGPDMAAIGVGAGHRQGLVDALAVDLAQLGINRLDPGFRHVGDKLDNRPAIADLTAGHHDAQDAIGQ